MRKRWAKRLLAFVLTVLLLSALVFTASGSSVVYLMSVNDKIMDVTVENMPMLSGGQLYIPYTMLSPQVSGINLGVRAQYTASRSLLTVTNGQKTVAFDVRRNLAADESGAPLDVYAMVRNTMVFIPIDWLCRYFPELGYSLTRTSYGILVRLTNSAARLNDAELIDSGDSLLRQKYLNYQNSLATPAPSTEPPVTPSPSPSPSPSPTPTAQPSTPPPTVEPEPAPLVYLAFRWGSATSEVATILERYQQRALFLFTLTELTLQDDLVRRLVGRGHQIGLVVTGDDADGCLEQIARGRQLLSDICRSSLRIVAADELGSAGRRELEEAGYALWQATLDGDSLTHAAILRRLSSAKGNYVQLTCTTNDLTRVSDLLRSLTGEDYRLRQALAPVI